MMQGMSAWGSLGIKAFVAGETGFGLIWHDEKGYAGSGELFVNLCKG